MNKMLDLSIYNPIAIKIASFMKDNIILKLAIEDNNYILCSWILKDIKEFNNYNLLIKIIKKNNNKLINLFIPYIKYYNIFEQCDHYDETILCYAVKYNNYNLCRFLVNYVSIDGNDNIYVSNSRKLSETPLCKAVINNNYKITKLLLENNANPNIWSGGGYGNDCYLPLHKAYENKNIKIIKLLLSYGAVYNEDLDISYGKYGFQYVDSVLNIAIQDKNIKIIKLFKSY